MNGGERDVRDRWGGEGYEGWMEGERDVRDGWRGKGM